MFTSNSITTIMTKKRKRTKLDVREEVLNIMYDIHSTIDSKDMGEYVKFFLTKSSTEINVTSIKHFLFTKARVLIYQMMQQAAVFDTISEEKVSAILKCMKTLALEALKIAEQILQLAPLQQRLEEMTENTDDPWNVVLQYIVDRDFDYDDAPVTFEQLIALHKHFDEDKVNAWSVLLGKYIPEGKIEDLLNMFG